MAEEVEQLQSIIDGLKAIVVTRERKIAELEGENIDLRNRIVELEDEVDDSSNSFSDWVRRG